MIPLANPKASYLEHKAEIDEAVLRVLGSGSYILGEEVKKFERDFAKYIGVKYCVGVASGTDALFLSMKALGIGKGDEVITVSHTAVATVAAIVMTGATPVLVDIEPYYMTIDPELIQESVTANTKAIIPVHIYGKPCMMDHIMRRVRKNKIPIIEDCAQSAGAIYESNRVGSIGVMGCFSFYPTKNLGCFGDGGAITTNSYKLYKKLLLLRQYGWKKRYISEIHGYNSRLDEIQAAVLNVKLEYLDYDNKRRSQIARNYGGLIADSDSVHHLHVKRFRKTMRNRIIKKFEEDGKQTAIHYPVPIHLQPGYKDLVRVSGTMKETERAAKEVLSLPMYPQL